MTEHQDSLHGLTKPSPVRFIHEWIQQLRLVWRLFRDRRVPVWIKAIPLLTVGYLFIPTDLVPDILAGLGQLDDVAVIALGLRVFLELAPPTVVQEHLQALAASSYRWTVIDGKAEPVNGSES